MAPIPIACMNMRHFRKMFSTKTEQAIREIWKSSVDQKIKIPFIPFLGQHHQIHSGKKIFENCPFCPFLDKIGEIDPFSDMINNGQMGMAGDLVQKK